MSTPMSTKNIKIPNDLHMGTSTENYFQKRYFYAGSSNPSEWAHIYGYILTRITSYPYPWKDIILLSTCFFFH